MRARSIWVQRGLGRPRALSLSPFVEYLLYARHAMARTWA